MEKTDGTRSARSPREYRPEAMVDRVNTVYAVFPYLGGGLHKGVAHVLSLPSEQFGRIVCV
jgi:hypothetical protein